MARQVPPAAERRGRTARPYQDRLPLWLGVGGTAAHAQRAGLLGLPMVLGLIGGATGHPGRPVIRKETTT